MSYCRWSSLNGYCDAYVYADINGGWTTHIAGRRRVAGVLSDGFDLLGAIPADADHEAASVHPAIKLWTEQHRLAMAQDLDFIDIDHPEAGNSFNHDTPSECADNLERLQREGFIIPNSVISDLREEENEPLDEHAENR